MVTIHKETKRCDTAPLRIVVKMRVWPFSNNYKIWERQKLPSNQCHKVTSIQGRAKFSYSRKHSFSLKCDKCYLCYSMCNCDFNICTCANQTFFYDSLLICATFQVSSVELVAFFGLYRGSYKLEVPKKGIFKIDINVSTCIAYAYCFLNYHRFHPLNSPSMTNVQKRKKMILLRTPFS